MLTGDELRSNGNAYSTACNLDSSRKQFLGNLGYCPQFDGLIGVLTGREMVSLFGRLRGVKSISEESRKWLQRVGTFVQDNLSLALSNLTSKLYESH
jgi:ABC-type multidrug transport system ATPase subunit